MNQAASAEVVDLQKKSTVLVVDDTPENIDVLRGILRPQYKVTVAINGAQAVKQCLSDHPPDLVLLDVMMPGMDGFEVCRQLKTDPRSEGIPVIFVTAMNETCDEVKGFAAGGVDYISKPVTPAIVLARVHTHLQLRSAYRFIRDTFGRYLSDEIVDSLIDSPEGLKLGGEKRQLSIMMADLRGFTSIGERLPAETVVRMINIFLGRMTDVIQHHQGTIDEFIGDAILAIFGAPMQREDDALRSVRCAVDMQLAMQDVNREYQAAGYPAVEMGIGINSGEAIVGNIGSNKRAKYGVVGRVVNTASRIESYTIGGQILIAESTKHACHGQLRIDAEMQVMPKGLSEPITIYDIGGVVGDNPVTLPPQQPDKIMGLAEALPVQVMALTDKQPPGNFAGQITGLGEQSLSLVVDQPCSNFTNLRLSLLQPSGQVLSSELYVKVTGQRCAEPITLQVHITSIPPQAAALFGRLRTAKLQAENSAQAVNLLHITDFHLYAEPARKIKGVCSHDSLLAVLEHASAQLEKPDAVILGGDLVQDETAEAYARLAAMLGDYYHVPFMVTPGNHASLSTLKHVLYPALQQLSAYAEQMEFPAWQVIALNSHAEGHVSGLLPESELHRLELLLAESAGRHVLIAIHHHPIPIGSRWMDDISLQNMDALWSVLDRHHQVRALLCGHIHQAFDRMHGSVRVLGTPSTCVQFVPQQDEFCLDGISPGYRWLRLLPDGSVQTGVERIAGFIPPDLLNDEPY